MEQIFAKVETDLKRAFKSKCADKGMKMRDVIEKLVRDYVKTA